MYASACLGFGGDVLGEAVSFLQCFVGADKNFGGIGITAFFFGYGAGNGQFQRFFVAAEGKFG